MLKRFIVNSFKKVAEINQRYSTGRIEMSPAVKFSLVLLRLYLLFLVGLMVYKFITIII